MTVSIIIIVVGLFASAFISASEAALIAVNRVRIRRMMEEGDPRAIAVQKVIGEHERFFGTILLAGNLVNILIATVVGALVADIIDGNPGVAVGVATGVTTLLIVTFGEITPKSIATLAPDRWSLASGRTIRTLMVVSGPFVYAFTLIPRGIVHLLGGKRALAGPVVTAGELRILIDMGEAEGTVASSQGEMLENIFRFGETEVREVLTPRPDIVWVSADSTFDEFLRTYSDHPQTRFPVFDEGHDDVVGILSVKDVMASFARSQPSRSESVTRLMRPPLFVPETKRLDDLFTMMQQSGDKIALAVDEYGGIAGLITLTKVIEQIVGQTGEEGRRPELRFVTVNENTFVVDGGMTIDEANDELEFEIPDGDYETMAGFFLEQAQQLPVIGARIRYGDLRLQVAELDGNKIASIRVRRAREVVSTAQRVD